MHVSQISEGSILWLRALHRWKLAFRIAASLTVSLALTGASTRAADPRFELGGMSGDAAGLDDGYTRIGTMIPVLELQQNLILFSDTHLLMYNEQSDALGANVGGGLRFYDAPLNRIFGSYIYYDMRNRELANHDQIGFGFETLGSIFDARLNVNVATDTDNSLVSRNLFGTPRFGGAGGQNIAVGMNLYQQAISTLDSEMGAMLYGNDQFQVKAFAGAYGLFADVFQNSINSKEGMATYVREGMAGGIDSNIAQENSLDSILVAGRIEGFIFLQ